MASYSMTDAAAVLKTLYKGNGAPNVTYRDHPAPGLLKKMDGFTGDSMKCPIVYGNGAGRSATIANALANTAAPSQDAFYLTRKSDFGAYEIDGETIEAAADDKGSFVRTLKQAVDAKFANLGQSLAHALYRDGTGSIGVVGALPGGNVFTLSNISDVVFFEVGQVLKASTGATKTAVCRAGSMTITAIDRNTGSITCGAGLIAGLAVNDWLFIEGDRQSAQITAHSQMLKIAGFDSWLDPTVGALTSADAFFGVTRSADTRLTGILLAPAVPYTTVEEGLIDCVSYCCAEGGRTDLALVHPEQFRKFVKEIGSKTEFKKEVKAQFSGGQKAKIGYKYIEIDGDKGPVKVVSDRNCPEGYGYCLDTSTWTIHHLGALPRLFNIDGLNLLRGTGDSYVGRMGYRGQLGCSAPGWNGRVVLPS